MASKRDYYEVLGVARNTSKKEISDAYRKLAIRYHPDSHPGDEEATERFKEAAEAYEVLNDPDMRARYDRHGHAGVSGTGGPTHFADVEDIFEAFGDLFGGGVFGDIFGGGRRRGRRRRRGADIKCEVTLDLEEAARGAGRTVRFRRSKQCGHCGGSGSAPGSSPAPCGRCGGRGQVVQSAGILRVQTTCPSCQGAGAITTDPCNKCRGAGYVADDVELEVAIPPGVDTGMRVRLPGEGEPSPDGGPAGDCYCFIDVREHPLFERDGLHLVLRVPITYPQAALGATIEVPTLEGRDNVVVPPGTQSGEVFRLQKYGMPDPHGRGIGDLLVQVYIEVPRKLSAEQKKALRELADIERSNVSPERKSFFEKLKNYFISSDEPAK